MTRSEWKDTGRTKRNTIKQPVVQYTVFTIICVRWTLTMTPLVTIVPVNTIIIGNM